VSHLTTEADYRATSLVLNEILWLRNLLLELNVLRKGPSKLWCDNKLTANIANNPVNTIELSMLRLVISLSTRR